MIALLITALLAGSCPLSAPLNGPVVRGYQPAGWFGGHWGVDIAAEPGTPVAAAAAGTVSFSGPVAGRISVTVHHGGGVRTSYSYLRGASVPIGTHVEQGDVIGWSGIDHGFEALHFSLRVGNHYVRPRYGECLLVPAPALRLVG